MREEPFFQFLSNARRLASYQSVDVFRDAFFGLEIDRIFNGKVNIAFINSSRSETCVYEFQGKQYLAWDQGQMDFFDKITYVLICLKKKIAAHCMQFIILKYMCHQFADKGMWYHAGWHLSQIVRNKFPKSLEIMRLDQSQLTILNISRQIQSLFFFGHEVAHLLTKNNSEHVRAYQTMAMEACELGQTQEEGDSKNYPFNVRVASGLFLTDPDAYADPQRSVELAAFVRSVLNQAAESPTLATELCCDMLGVDYVIQQPCLRNLNKDHIAFSLNLSLLVTITISMLRSIANATYFDEDINFTPNLRANLARFLILNHFIDARLGYTEVEPNPANIMLAAKYNEIGMGQIANYLEYSVISFGKRENIKKDLDRMSATDIAYIQSQVREYLNSHYYGVDIAI